MSDANDISSITAVVMLDNNLTKPEESLLKKVQKKPLLASNVGGKVMESVSCQPELLSCTHAKQLIEYQWPLNGGEFYLFQEQVCAYLNIKSFKRKYPNIKQRKLEADEIEYLRTNYKINHNKYTLGLTALKSADVCDMMMKKYPEKFKEFCEAMKEKEKQKMNNQYAEYASKIVVEKSQLPAFKRKAIKQVSAYNSMLNKNRREDYSVYYDAHTNTIHRPARKVLKLDPKYTTPSLYPCSLIPGQFQEYCKKYTSQELMYLPVKTALYGPPQPPLRRCDISDTESEVSSDDNNKMDLENADNFVDNESKKNITDIKNQDENDEEEPPTHETLLDTNNDVPKIKEKPVCGICGKDSTSNKNGISEDLIKCSQCDNHGHPSCLDMNDELIEVMKTYDWQCMECKTCTICSQPHREDLMMFCDRCDRGYHSYCVSLRIIPSGVWACSQCVHEDPKFKKRKTKQLKQLQMEGGDDVMNKRTDRKTKSKSKVLLQLEKKKFSEENLKNDTKNLENNSDITEVNADKVEDLDKTVTNGNTTETEIHQIIENKN